MGMLFRDFARDLRARKHDIIAAVLVFGIGIYAGFTSDHLGGWLEGEVESIGNIADLLERMPYPQLMFFLFIFLNNLVKSLLFVFLGAFFGLFPLVSLLINGMVIGYLSASTMAHGGNLAQMIVLGILPHGIIELPMVLLASAYGLRFGVLTGKWAFSFAVLPWRQKVAGELRHFFRMTLPLMLVLTVGLLVAAVIESTVTYSLMGH
ncbi:MAG TPA: stage II sporulation protein M [Bacilli bacterium]